jgi:pentatricopeptide repeat protein
MYSSPLHAIAKQLLYISRGTGQSGRTNFISYFHTSSLLLGGRYTTQEPDRVKHWRQHLSKKAKKRISRSTALSTRREGAAAGNVLASIHRQELIRRSTGASTNTGSTLALSNGSSRLSSLNALSNRNGKKQVELTPAKIALLSRRNQTVIQTVLMSEAPPVRESDALKQIDIDILGRSLRSLNVTQFDKRAWIDLIRACGAQGKFSQAVAAFSDMRVAASASSASRSESESFDAYAYTALLHSCGLQRNIDAATSVFNSMLEDGVAPTHVTIGALIQAHVRSFDLKGAAAILAAALKDGVSPTPLLFTPIIVGHIQNGQHEEAWEVFHSMREFHCEPDVVTYTAMISSCAKRDMVEKALNLFDELRKNGHTATHVTYSTVLHASARSMRLYHHAFSIFHEMGTVSGLSHDVRSFNAVLLACSQQGDVVRAREYMASMLKQNLKPDSVTAATLLTVYARALKNVRLMGVPKGGAAAALSSTGLRGVDALVSKSPSSTVAKPSDVDDYNARNANGLSLLDRDGLLDPSKRLIEKRVLERLPQARLIEGSTNDVVEGLLRDYYVGPRTSGGDGSVEEESLLDSLAHRGVDRDKSLQERYLPPMKDISLNLGSDEYKSFRDALLASGIVDKDLIDDIEEEHGRMPSLNPKVEAARAEKFEKRHIARMQKLEQEALALAESEAATAKQLSAVSSSSSSLSSSLPLSPSTSSSMLLDAIQKGEKLSLEDYLVALEKEVMTGLYGPQTEFNSLEKSTSATDGKKQSNWDSLFASPDSIIGGIPLRDLLDESTVKLPPPSKEDIELGGTGAIADALRDPIEVTKYIRSAIEKRVQEALEREAESNTDIAIDPVITSTTSTFTPDMQPITFTQINVEDAQTKRQSSSPQHSLIESNNVIDTSELVSSDLVSPSTSHRDKKRGFTARVLSRLLEPSSVGKLESLLLHATDDDAVSILRNQQKSSSVGLADVLIAVQKLKAKFNNGSLFSDSKTTTTTTTTSLQDEAVLDMAKWIDKRGTAGSVRFRGLMNISDGAFGEGAHWLTSIDAYPSDTTNRKKALIEEVKMLIFKEFPRMGVTADLPLMNAALSCLCSAGESKAAYDLLSSHFPRLSLSPDTRTFRPLIRMHVSKGETSRAEASLSAMKDLGLSPDAECFGLVVHSQAKDWRVRDAIETIREMRDKYNVELPEYYAALLRRRCKEMGIMHPLVPEHPIGWMYTERIMEKKKADSVETRKQVRQGVRHVLKNGMR